MTPVAEEKTSGLETGGPLLFRAGTELEEVRCVKEK